MRRLRHLTAIGLLVTATSFGSPKSPNRTQGLYGFHSDSTASHLDLEEKYRSQLDGANLKEWMRTMTSRPHHAGSLKAKQNAELMAQLFRSWGYETEIEVFHVLFPTPKERRIDILGPEPASLGLTEEVATADSAADSLLEEGLPPFNAYSADGDVTGDLVYVNYGVPADYQELDRQGISVEGKLVIARYGGSWRGIKPKVAAEKGAVGCIIFNDPAADGFPLGEPYPEGPYKHETAVQRGSVLDLPVRPGDPLTPYVGATEQASRLARKEAETIMKIPVLPISYRDALQLFRVIGGDVAPPAWRGGMPVTYRVGGTNAVKIRLQASFRWDLEPAYNVLAKLRGAEFPDQWIVRGNHHDAWVIGAHDPVSGMVTVLEQARAMAELVKSGWRPRRTIVFCAWDAEEPGLLGSTEWVEGHREELVRKAVAYVNTDGNSRGFLNTFEGSHSLEKMAVEAAHAVKDPQTGVAIPERLQALLMVQSGGATDRDFGLRLEAPGCGSDYSPFIQHLGIASLNLGFSGEGAGGEYHTMFDTFDHYIRHRDPSFEYGVALTELCGLITLRLAQADVVPFDFEIQAETVKTYVTELEELVKTMRDKTIRRNVLLDEGLYQLAADPLHPKSPPEKNAPVPHFNFAPLRNAVERLQFSAQRYSEAQLELLSGNVTMSAPELQKLNRVLFQSERALIREEGLPGRPWFRHQLYAPGRYTGYSVKTLPGIREAIEERQWEEVNGQIEQVAAYLEKLTKRVDEATSLIRRN